MQILTLSPKYQIYIPKLIREQMHLEVDQQFVLVPKGNAFYLVPYLKIEDVKGLLPKANITKIRDRDDRT